MAIKGIGVDVVELARITDVVEKHPNFGMRLFTKKERARAFEPQRDIAAIAVCGERSGKQSIRNRYRQYRLERNRNHQRREWRTGGYIIW